MEIGIYDMNEATKLGYRQRLDIYRETGFHSVSLYIDQSYMNKGEHYGDIIDYAREIGLKVNQVHIDYKISNDICNDPEKYYTYLIGRLSECRAYGIENMVLHASYGEFPPGWGDEQIAMIEELADEFPEINLAFENVRNNENLIKLLELRKRNITLCYDMGHAHIYNADYMLDKYSNKITCAHLHNNYGSDDHNLLSDGDINYTPVLTRLEYLEADCCLEVFPKRDKILSEAEFVAFVKQAYEDCF